MKIDNKYLYLMLGIFFGGILVWFLLSNFSSKNYKGMMRGEDISSRNKDVIDAHFIEQMIPHHEDAITMSKIALINATSPEVKKLAENIITTQTEEINQMKAWYKDWYGRDLPTGDEVMQVHGMGSGSSMHMGMMGSEMDLDNLENAEDFDREFLEQMIPHHQMAVMMASMLKNGTNRNEMKELAVNIITTQTEEIDLMRNILKGL